LLAVTVLEYASHIEPAPNFNGGLNNKRAGTEEASLMDELVSSLVDQHRVMGTVRETAEAVPQNRSIPLVPRLAPRKQST
jgi:hypothetical protein